MRKEGIVLKHHADASLLRRNIRDFSPIDEDAAGSWLLEAGNHAQQRRLAAAAGTKDREELAGRNFKTYALNSVGVLEVFGKIVKSYG